VRVLYVCRSQPGSLEILRDIARHHEIVAVVESGMRRQRARSVGRSILSQARGMKQARVEAARLRVPYLFTTRDNLPELGELVSRAQADVGCIYGMAHLLPEEIWRVPRCGFLNMHPSLLPLYRGPAPMLWQALRLERETGVTIFQIDDGEDTGDILFKASRAVTVGQPASSWHKTYADLGARGFLDVLGRLERGERWGEAQRDLPCPFRARNPKRGERLIDWDEWTLDHVFHALRGTQDLVDHVSMQFPTLPDLRWSIVRAVEGPDQRGSTRWTARGLELGHPEGHILVRPAPSLSQVRRVARFARSGSR
jgi:methionyl-tRNA formyltransferase